MKSVFKMQKLFLLFIFCVGFYFSASSTETWKDSARKAMPGNPDEGQDTGPMCEAAKMSAVEATTGMDMSSYMLVATAGQGVAQVASQGDKKSAQMAHQAAGAVHGTLGVVAAKKYMDCSSAITVCETQCESCPEAKEATAAELKTVEATCKKSLAECVALNGPCNAAIAQALASGLQMAGSFLVAKSLGEDCEGDDCDTGADDDPPPIPQNIEAPSNNPVGMVEQTGEPSPVNSDNIRVPGTPKMAKSAPGKGRTPGSSDSSDDPNGDPTSQDPTPDSLTSLAGGFVPSSGFDMDSHSGEDDEEGEEEALDEGRYPSDTTSGFAGGAVGDTKGNSARPSHRSARGGKKLKLALNNKNKLAGARDVFKKAGPHDSIFTHMSRVIQSYCAEGRKCQEVVKK